MRRKVLNALVYATRSSLVDGTGAATNAALVLSTRVTVCAASDCSVGITSARTPATLATVNDAGK